MKSHGYPERIKSKRWWRLDPYMGALSLCYYTIEDGIDFNGRRLEVGDVIPTGWLLHSGKPPEGYTRLKSSPVKTKKDEIAFWKAQFEHQSQRRIEAEGALAEIISIEESPTWEAGCTGKTIDMAEAARAYFRKITK